MEEIINPSQTYFSMAAIVDQCCIDLELPSDKFFNKLLSWGLWEFVNLKLDSDYQPITELLTVSDVNTVRIPANWVAVTKIGVPVGQYISVLSVCEELSAQERLPNSPQFSASAPPGTLPNGVDISNYGGLYSFANFGGRTLWGVSGSLPKRGHYKLVRRQNGEQELLLDAGLSLQQIYIEGIGLGVNASGATVCHPYLADFVRKAIHHNYQKFLRGPEKLLSEIERTGREMWDAQVVVRGRTSNLDRSTLLTILRRNYKLTNPI